MASTNKTTNYELSQFLGSDKPAWLSDYNSDMNKIDTQMKANADAATAAGGTASSAATAIGDLTELTTTAKTSTVAAINEVDSNADTAQNTANSAYSAASSNASAIAALSDYLNLNTFTTPPVSVTNAVIAQSITEISCASNSTGTLGKIYGRIGYDSTAATSTITFSTPLRPDTAITINGIAFNEWSDDGSTWSNPIPTSVSIGTDGMATITISGSTNGRKRRVIFMACVIFAKSFGDVPIPE